VGPFLLLRGTDCSSDAGPESVRCRGLLENQESCPLCEIEEFLGGEFLEVFSNLYDVLRSRCTTPRPELSSLNLGDYFPAIIFEMMASAGP
jgi:hypothetical protein